MGNRDVSAINACAWRDIKHNATTHTSLWTLTSEIAIIMRLTHTACTRRTDNEKDESETCNSRALKRVNDKSLVRLRSRKSRCRFGLEHNCGQYSSRERPEPVRPSTICSDRTTRCIRIRERHHARVSSLSRNDRYTAGSMPRSSSDPGCLSRA